MRLPRYKQCESSGSLIEIREKIEYQKSNSIDKKPWTQSWHTFLKQIFRYSITESITMINLNFRYPNKSCSEHNPHSIGWQIRRRGNNEFLRCVAQQIAGQMNWGQVEQRNLWTWFSYACRSCCWYKLSSLEKGGKMKRAQASPPHPTSAMSLKRMLCSAALLHYQETVNLFDSASGECPPLLLVLCSQKTVSALFLPISLFSKSRAAY